MKEICSKLFVRSRDAFIYSTTDNIFLRVAINILLFLCLPFLSSGQEEGDHIYIQGNRYLDVNIKSQEKACKRISRQQEKLLKKLKKKEARYANRLKRKDSVSYARYQQNPLTYESIYRLRKHDSSSILKRASYSRNGCVDSLRNIKRFIEDKGHVTGEAKSQSLEGYDHRLQELKTQLDQQQTTNALIEQRTGNLEKLSAGSKSKVSGLIGIQKQVFYGKGKMDAFKQISDEPSKAEEKALEYLQGQDGFESYLKSPQDNSLLSDKSPAQLEKLGLQTKKQVEASLKERIGGSTGVLQSSLTGQVKDLEKHRKKLEDFKSKKAQAKQSKRSLMQARNLKKPSFKVNPMRCKPFAQRLEKQFNYQTIRANAAGDPATLQTSVMVGYKHTPSITTGIGVVSATGLGKNWSSVRFTFEGIGIRTYSSWKWQYGFGAYAGYERTYKHAAFYDKNDKPSVQLNSHNTTTYNESVLIGLTKSYKLNSKWQGEVQLLYDVWWKEKGLRSPIQFRFATIKN